MPRIRAFLLALAACAGASIAAADTITSTGAGGPWFEGATWEGGVVPGDDDDVVIAGPVAIAGTAACASLAVNAPGSVGGAFAGPSNKLQVSGPVTNAGTIDDGAFNFFVEVGGDLHNAGIWANHQTTITGSSQRQLSHAPAAGLATNLVFAVDATCDLTATTPLEITGNVDATAGRLILGPECPFTSTNGEFRGNLAASGNELRFAGWSYLTFCTIDDVVLVGLAKASFAVTFTTRVTVMDTLENSTSGGGGSVTVEGDLVNNGVIRNVQYSFPVRVRGDVENNGSITNPQLELLGAGAVHHLSMSPDAFISAPVFLPEFQASTLIADTPVRFAGGLGLGVGTLILESGSSLQFTGFGGMGSGTVLANGNSISVAGTGAIGHVTIDRGVIADQVAMLDDNLFTGGLTVTGTLTSWEFAGADVTVEGLLRNDGVIRDGAHPVRIVALGDVANLGTMENARVALAGVVDQAVGAGPQGIAVPEFGLESNLQGASYQWYRNGLPLPGETAVNLVLATVGPADYGTYHCVGDGEVSRNIAIAETIATTGVPGVAATVRLAQNHPNPFNPATEIAFSLDRAARVSLVVYDLAGREVDRLVDRELAAGGHQVTWQPRDLASGIYVYRMQADGRELSRRCTLIK